MELILRHSPGLKRFMQKERGPLENIGQHLPITMATPLHHNQKLYEATPRTGRTLFWWVTTPLKGQGREIRFG